MLNSNIKCTELQNKSSRDVLRKKCLENMQQIYRRTPISKCFYWNHTSVWVFLRTLLKGYFWNSKVDIILAFFLWLTFVSFSRIGKEFWTIQNYLKLKLADSRNYMLPILVPSSVKPIAKQISVIAQLNGRKDFILSVFFLWYH